MRSSLLGLFASWLLACGAGTASNDASEHPLPPEPAASEAPGESAAPAADTPPPAPEPPVPAGCASGAGDDCAPPSAWVTKLCNGVYAEVALVMFRGGTPWQRRYLRGKTRAVNASGGATVEGSLLRDEEVLVLRHRKDAEGGMQIGDGGGQYDALRWNGSCVTLEAGEVTGHRPGAPGQARIEWRWLGEGMRSALRQDEAVNKAFLARKQECRGATTGTVTKACERLDGKLIERIASYVRSGPDLPAPEEHP